MMKVHIQDLFPDFYTKSLDELRVLRERYLQRVQQANSESDSEYAYGFYLQIQQRIDELVNESTVRKNCFALW